MTDAIDLLTSCDREPIHIPGSIQPHGVMLVAARDGLVVHHVAGDVEGRLAAVAWQGAPLSALIGHELAARVAERVEAGRGFGFIGQHAGPTGERLDVATYPSGTDVIVEIEPATADAAAASEVLDRLEGEAVGFEQASSLQALCDRAARAFREITGFDRVMIYRFQDDEAGRVVAEARREGMQPFLNHHFPASDIPKQARALYLRNLTRVIPDIAYRPAPLRPAWTGAEPLDMSDSSLRSVSPVHLQYLANMGVGASASISIVKDDVLWGLVACHHDTPRLMPYGVRVACRALAGGFARQIKAKEEAESYRQRIRLRAMEDEIIGLLSREGTLDDALSNHLGELGRIMDAEGVAVLRGHELILGGVHPTAEQTEKLAAWLLTRTSDTVFSTDSLQADWPPGEEFREQGSGVLAVTLSTQEPWLLMWFRAEQIEVVNWAGNPHKGQPGADGVLTPRGSFDAWQETVRGRSRRWTLPETDAARRLRGALLEVRQNRRLRDLNRRLTDILRDKDQLLEQKDSLIGEVNHRVQNSLQLVSSFLALQGRATDSDQVRASLDEARRRLSAVALVHRRLYRGNEIQVIDAARYVEELCHDTLTSMGADWTQHLALDLQPVMIPTDRAVTLGLVVTELMINVNKYAYDGAPGPLEVRLLEDRTNLILVVADKGKGKSSPRKGFGSRMMEGLAQQLGGTLAYADNRPGLRATLTAPTQVSTRAV